MDEEENAKDEEPEFWDDFPEAILDDLGKEQPLPEPRGKSTVSKKMTSLLQWFILFILLWQANCKISNNGLEWLLRFLFQFLHLIGTTCHCEYLVKFCTMFPTSLYVLRQLVNLTVMILLNTRCVPTAHPCMTLVTALNELEEGLLQSAVCTKLLRRVREQGNVEQSWQKELCCQMERNVFILLKCTVLTA